MNRRQFLTRTAAGTLVTLSGLHCGPPSDTGSPDPTGIRLRPPPGRVWIFGGQNAEAIGGFGKGGWLDEIPEAPDGLTFYASFPDTPGDPDWVASWSGEVEAAMALEKVADAVLHLSVQWVNEGQSSGERLSAQQAVVDGAHDATIDGLAAWLSTYGRPVLLRLGYEFDRPIKYYDSTLFVPAFRRIVERLCAAGVENIATCWSSANLGPFKEPKPDTWEFATWYPGDDVVDWFGFSMWYPDNHDTVMLDEARKRGKPVLLAETSPLEWDLGNGAYYPLFSNEPTPQTDQEMWDGWFVPMIAFIQANADIIAGWHYISVDWRADPLWQEVFLFKNSDARLWANAGILKRWRAAVALSPFRVPA
jgi:hypothetical protein